MRASLALWILMVFVCGACTRVETTSPDMGGPCFSVGSCTHICLPSNIWPNGFCTRACTRDTDCAVGSVCAIGVCLYSCFDDQDCTYLRDGLGCHGLEGKLVCTPPDLPDAGVTDAR